MAFVVDCPLCGEEIVLPRHSPLGTGDGLRYQPTDVWPVAFLCVGRGQVCECPADTHLESIPLPDQSSEMEFLWEIQCECAHIGCGARKTIYTKQPINANASSVVQKLVDAIPFPCTEGDHSYGISAETAEARMFR
jgi:hypothetical protein